MSTIVVSGALANKPANGGATWTRLSWALGLKRLGHQVFFVEQISPEAWAHGTHIDFERSNNVAYFRTVMDRFGLGDASALVLEGGDRTVGLTWDELSYVASHADLLVNISGHLVIKSLKDRVRRRIFIDLDPGYTQFWHEQNLASDRLRDHHLYFTVGENIGTSECTIPTAGIEWHPCRQPVVLEEWPLARPPLHRMRYTTIASWRGPFGRVTHGQQVFGVKAHEFRKFRTLPSISPHWFEIALDAHAADGGDVEQLRQNGWAIVDAPAVAGDPLAFRGYVQHSAAEFSVAQGIYVDTQSGWFSDRSVRYLASGKPVLVQDTGFSRNYPVGRGLIAFSTLQDAARGADLIAAEYDEHARAARALAETYFDSDEVLTSLLKVTENGL